MRNSLIRSIMLVFLVTAVVGCATPGPDVQPPFRGAERGIRIGDIVNTRTGNVVGLDLLVEDLSKARVVYVGELHTSVEDHRVQLDVLKLLHERNPHLVMAVEMLPRSAQPVLDLYCRKAVTEEQFLRDAQWEKAWGYPFRLYRGLFEFAREKKLKIIALNAPNPIVNKIAQNGLSSLTLDERAQIAREFHGDTPANRARIGREYTDHLKGNIKDFQTFFEAQLAWEETMAETVADILSREDEKTQVLVLIGKGHMRDRLGTPELAGKRVGHTYRTIAPMPVDHPLSVSDPNIADYVWITDRNQERHRGRLGVMIRPHESGAGLEVLGVISGGPAAKAGIVKGDVILAIDGVALQSVEDVHRVLAHKANIPHLFLIRRDGADISVTIAISK